MDVQERVVRRIDHLSRLMNTHAGDIRLVAVTEDGHVTVEFGGMCTGCPFKPLTMAGTVRPGLLAIEGVTSVDARGSRISEEAEKRLARALAGSLTPSNAWLSVLVDDTTDA